LDPSSPNYNNPNNGTGNYTYSPSPNYTYPTSSPTSVNGTGGGNQCVTYWYNDAGCDPINNNEE
jgi:hypothetical protein